ncbi:MAG: cytochrome c oxidase subunit 3 [Chitinophagales bacterium]|nr:cytochrome c oxidase subunit 3 [Chitinophagales bacterium]
MMIPVTELYRNQKAQRFSMWLALVGICMAFAGLTSAYIVRKGAGSWLLFNMPEVFYTSTVIILLSSVTLHVAHVSNKKGHTNMTVFGLGITAILGILFSYFQYQGWLALLAKGIYLDGNPSGSFFYVITGLHVVHLLVGVVFVFVALFRAFWLFKVKRQESTIRVGSDESYKVRTDLLSMYWHFLDILWIYLFVFLNLNLK